MNLKRFEVRKFRAQAPWYKTRSKRDKIFRWLRSCAVCGSTLSPIDLLCASCWQIFESNMNQGSALEQSGYPFPVYSLLTWNEPNERFVRPIVKGQKNGHAFQGTKKLMDQLSFQRQWSLENGLPIFLYPPSAKGYPDHAALLATHLACVWGGLPLALRWQGKTRGQQKSRAASVRTERRFEELDLASFTLPSTRWIFVDDVITTGSTAMAAYMALGTPECFETWTLACRPKLANQASF